MRKLNVLELTQINGGGGASGVDYIAPAGIMVLGLSMFVVGMLGLCPPVRGGNTNAGIVLPRMHDHDSVDSEGNEVEVVRDVEINLSINKPILSCGSEMRFCCGSGCGPLYNAMLCLGFGLFISGLATCCVLPTVP